MSTTPNLLLGAGLIFWGWQTGFPLLGVLMAVTLELRHLLKDRWDLGEEDFTRIWVFCVVLFVTAGVYAFTSNEGPAGVISFFREPGFATQRSAGLATARSAAALLRWLPMVFLPLIAAELYSTGRGIPLESISLFLRRRKRLAQKFGEVLPPARRVSSFYPYFGICLFSGSIRPNLTEDQTYFYGMGVLMAWALVQSRSPRYPRLIWAFTLAVAMFIAYVGQYELGQAQRYLENINPTWLVSPGRRGFDPKQTRTMIGQVGRLKLSGNIVIRLQTPPNSKAPPLLREASYRIYRSPIWSLGNTASQFEPVQGEPDGLTWVLAISPTNGTQVNIASYLPGGTGLLPLPGGSVRLENLPAFGLQKSDTGSVLAQGPGLVIFDALPGRGGTIDAPPDTLEDYLVPGREKYALRQVIDEAHLAGLGRAETLQAIQRFFEARFSYRTWQVPFGRRGITNETALGRFLLKDRSGHCEYFATATVLLLRELKIPARYAVGYAVHEHSGNGYVVRQRDAHAWCLVWNEQRKQWEDLDTTPGTWYEAESSRAGPLEWLSDLWGRLSFEFSKFRWGQSKIRQYAIWALIPLLALLVFQIVYRSRKKLRRNARSNAEELDFNWQGLDSELYELEKKLSGRWADRAPSEPLAEWFARMSEDPALAGQVPRITEVLNLHYRYRFDPAGLTAAERVSLRSGVQACLAAMA